ncbi:MAG: general secretion pathway protein GspK [Kiritimatiellae bacterium]|nr:general secretion pathway protein GspK [Kiritimatiellia bacterium]
MSGKRGSALVLAIWIIAVLSILVMNFAGEARLTAGVNLFIRERVHVFNLTETGRAIAEVVMLNYKNVAEASEDETEEDLEEALEQNRWLEEERDLKTGHCVIGPVPVDHLNPDAGTVTVEITTKESKFNINTLYQGGDPNYRDIWELILEQTGVPEDERDQFIDQWNDWRDNDSSKTGDEGAEEEEYRDYDGTSKNKIDRLGYKPRNNEIPDLKELAKIIAFREHPGVLTGGVYDPEEDREQDQIRCTNVIMRVFDVIGSGKINVNTAPKEVLKIIPGIGDAEDEEEAEAIAASICDIRNKGNADPDRHFAQDDDYGPFKDWNDLVTRMERLGGSETIGEAAQNYLIFAPETYFEVAITGTSLGISHTVKGVAMVKDDKVVYLRWQEDP